MYVVYNVYNSQHISIFLNTFYFAFAFSLALRAAPPLRARKRKTMSPSDMGGWFVALAFFFGRIHFWLLFQSSPSATRWCQPSQYSRLNKQRSAGAHPEWHLLRRQACRVGFRRRPRAAGVATLHVVVAFQGLRVVPEPPFFERQVAEVMVPLRFRRCYLQRGHLSRSLGGRLVDLLACPRLGRLLSLLQGGHLLLSLLHHPRGLLSPLRYLRHRGGRGGLGRGCQLLSECVLCAGRLRHRGRR